MLSYAAVVSKTYFVIWSMPTEKEIFVGRKSRKTPIMKRQKSTKPYLNRMRNFNENISIMLEWNW